MSDAALARAVQPSPDLLARPVGDELVLLDLATEQYFALDDVGAAMWQAISDTADLRAARDRLLMEFDVSEDELTADLLELVERLDAKGLLLPEGA